MPTSSKLGCRFLKFLWLWLIQWVNPFIKSDPIWFNNVSKSSSIGNLAFNTWASLCVRRVRTAYSNHKSGYYYFLEVEHSIEEKQSSDKLDNYKNHSLISFIFLRVFRNSNSVSIIWKTGTITKLTWWLLSQLSVSLPHPRKHPEGNRRSPAARAGLEVGSLRLSVVNAVAFKLSWL